MEPLPRTWVCEWDLQNGGFGGLIPCNQSVADRVDNNKGQQTFNSFQKGCW